jgi:hypothetical protein
MSKRKVHIDGEIWTWKVAWNGVWVRSPENKKHLLPMSCFYPEGYDMERAKWKGYFEGITPGEVKAAIQSEIITPENDVPVSQTVPLLKRIFNEEAYGEYVGGTLTVKWSDEGVLMFNVGQGRTHDENYWIALNYIKYKPKGVHFQEAYRTIKKIPRFSKHLAKAMLKASSD